MSYRENTIEPIIIEDTVTIIDINIPVAALKPLLTTASFLNSIA